MSPLLALLLFLALARAQEHELPPNMDLEGLRATVEQAAWQAPPGTAAHPLKVVILTACDVNCMLNTFDAWMASIRTARDGDLSRHVVVVCFGEAAYQFCRVRQLQHPHQCVLDPAHGLPRHATGGQAAMQGGADVAPMHFKSEGYMLSLLRKVAWIRAVAYTDVAPLFMDMDILTYRALLPRLVQGELAEADFIITDEKCNLESPDGYKTFPEAVQVTDQFVKLNAGIVLVKPNEAGRGLMDVWLGRYWARQDRALHLNDLTASGLEQGELNRIINQQIMEGPAVGMSPTGRWHQLWDKNLNALRWTRPPAKVYKLNYRYYQSTCSSICGCGPTSQQRMRSALLRNNVLAMCPFTQEYMAEYVVMHMTCLKTSDQKGAYMRQLYNISRLAWQPPRSAQPRTSQH